MTLSFGDASGFAGGLAVENGKGREELRAPEYSRGQVLGGRKRIISGECQDARERLKVPSRCSEMKSEGAGAPRLGKGKVSKHPVGVGVRKRTQ
jgi:hypothetical protein